MTHHMQPFFAALQDLMLASDQRGTPVAQPAPQRAVCQYCGGSGQSHSAYGDRDCNHCGDGWDMVCDSVRLEDEDD